MGPPEPNGIDVPEWNVCDNHLRNGGPEMNATTYGLDVAKRVFQMYWVDAQSGEISHRRFGRAELIEFLARRPAGRVALEHFRFSCLHTRRI